MGGNKAMPVKLFKLRNVPDDEAAEVRQLLADHAIDFYETAAGGWGISMPAIWLRDSSQLAQARALIDEYQKKRTAQARVEYEQLKKQGQHKTVMDKIRESPAQFVLLFILTLFILYVSLAPFLQFGE
jgi:hypothetical protein